MHAQEPGRRGWRLRPLDAFCKRSLSLFILALALQSIIVLSAMPGKAQVEPDGSPGQARTCLPRCTTIVVNSVANTLVSSVYTTTYSIDINPITKTILIGELSGALAEYLSVQANQGSPPIIISPMTYSWNVGGVPIPEDGASSGDVFLPLVLTTTVLPVEAGIHTQTLGRHITATRVAEARTTTEADRAPRPFTLRYRFPAVVPAGVITETYFIAPGSGAITQTVMTGQLLTGTGVYRRVMGSNQTSCSTTDQGFSCTVPDLSSINTAITATIEAGGPGQLVRGLSVSGGGERLPLVLTTTVQPPPFIPVIIDIKPGGEPNSINPKSRGNIPVAIFSTPDFRVEELDVRTLAFGPTGTEASPAFCKPRDKPKDLNRDGLPDLVCHFDTQTTGFEVGDRVGRLTGRTLSGEPIFGQDSVRIVPP